MEIVFNGKTYTKFQRLWNDIHFNRGFDDDHKFCHSVGLIYCRDHVSNLYRMYEKDFHDGGYKLEAVLAIDKYDNFLNSDEVIEYDEKNERPLEYYASEDGSCSCSMKTSDDECNKPLDNDIDRLLEERIKAKEEKVNHPNYYNRYSVEVVEMARRIWGDEAMKTAAEITAFIYRMRAGVKPDNPIEQDLAKEEFWLNYAKKINIQK